MKHCTHTDQIRPVEPPAQRVCEECIKVGGRWVHLRQCLTCGHMGCCDSSPGKHATKHYQSSHHPIVRSMEPGERWAWCYVDEMVLETR
ncbi:MAG TPA: UBP-type zinc finger domain-containing protein [Bryobacteraceae bacterium]|nr:UBP-type zinc finger domain-containing protein [Bryobacteraceae bacterium]